MSRVMKTGLLVLLMTLLVGAFCGASADELKLELDKAYFEKTIYEDGTDNWIMSFDIVNYETLQAAWGGEPVWSICAEDGGATPFDWSNSSLDGKSIWLYRDKPARNGDYTAILSCSWNGQTASVKITVHVVSAPNGPLLGSTGIDDEYVLDLNQEIHLNVQTIPADWSLPGERLRIEQWVTRACTPVEPGTDDYTYEEDGEPFFHITYGSTAGDITLKALMPGVYKTSFYIRCANYAVNREDILITVKNADGSIPTVEIPTISFTESEITVRANEPYVLKYSSNISFQEMYLYGYNGETNWEDETEYTVNEETGEITCVTKAPGYYTVRLSYWSNYLNESIEATIQINVLTETGDIPLKLNCGDAEYTLYEGGTNNRLNWYDISGYDQLKAEWGGEPEWSICAEDGGETPISWSNGQPDGKLIWLGWLGDGNPNPAVKGDYTAILTCSWHGQTASAKITVHVIPAPNGPLLGSAGIEDEYVLDLNEELHLNVKTVPDNWTIPGERLRIEHWVTHAATPVEPGMNDYTYEEDGRPFFNITYGSTAGDITLKALMPGVYKTSFYVQCANYEVNRKHILITVKNVDGTIPELKIPTVAFTDSEITVRANEPYALKYTSNDVSPEDLEVWYNNGWGDCSEYTLDGEAGEIKCVTSEPGYYQVALACWDYFQENWVETSILVKVADEDGNLPEADPLVVKLFPIPSATVGEAIQINWSVNAPYSPYTDDIQIYKGSKKIAEWNYNETDKDTYIFDTTGTYRIRIICSDVLKRSVSDEIEVKVTQPKALLLKGLTLRANTSIVTGEIIQGGIRWDLDYEGGYGTKTTEIHLINEATNEDSVLYDWGFLPSFTESRIEDGTYHIRMNVKDDEGDHWIESNSITLGNSEQPKWDMILPANTRIIEESAFEGIAAERVWIHRGCEAIRASAFANSSVTAIYIPDTVTEIGENAIPEGATIYTPENSFAANWAGDHYQVITMK